MNNGALHDKMIANIMKTPISFFESTSPGVIMNRFSKDMGQIDDMMPACFSDAMSIALQSLIILALSVYANYFSILLSGFVRLFSDFRSIFIRVSHFGTFLKIFTFER